MKYFNGNDLMEYRILSLKGFAVLFKLLISYNYGGVSLPIGRLAVYQRAGKGSFR